MEPLGTRLKRERERRKITLDEIALSTKIGTRLLVAIEEEHFDQLPGGIFNKNFVRSYARYVGMDEVQAVADYESAIAPAPVEDHGGTTPPLAIPSPAAPALLREDLHSDIARIPWEWLAIALLLLAFGLACWGFFSRDKSRSPVSWVTPTSNSSCEAG